MAGTDRESPLDLVFDALRKSPRTHDFFQVMRRIECATREANRLGEARLPRDEPLRLTQQPTLAFRPSAIAEFRDAEQPDRPPLLSVNFFGMFGPKGALPIHLTEYAINRERHHRDPTFRRFLDIFHHRMLLLLYRSWAVGKPTVNRDRPDSDQFASYVAALVGLGADDNPTRVRSLPRELQLFYAGRFAAQARNAEGLQAIIQDYFGIPVEIEQLVGSWSDLPIDAQWALGEQNCNMGRLGENITLGDQVWLQDLKFRLVLGPLDRAQFVELTPPGDARLHELIELVRLYVGDELDWDIRLVPNESIDSCELGGSSRLGLTAWLGGPPPDQLRAAREHTIVDPTQVLAHSYAAQ